MDNTKNKPKIWVREETDANIGLMSETLGINPITAKVLAGRGIRSKNAAIKYLNPQKKYMHSGALLKDMGAAVSVALSAVSDNKNITVYGDYDVDGVACAVILVKALEALGGNVSYYIPGRTDEGYGLNKEAVRHLKSIGTDLIIACDNGIVAFEEIELANELGMDVLVIDHHEAAVNESYAPILPNAIAIINQKRPDCEYPFKYLCAAALCYKFANELFAAADCAADNYATPNQARGRLQTQKHRMKWDELDDELLIFASLATICDVVSLTDENRIITVNGLAALNRGTKNIGLKALLEARGLLGKRIGVFDVGFIIGPCINAAGRLDTADLAVEMFLSHDRGRADELAGILSSLNDERRKLTDEAADRMLAEMRRGKYDNDKVYVLYDKDTHESVAGIVAGRVKEAFNHPVIMFTDSSEAGIVKGSARSVKGYGMYNELAKNRALFHRFGGHEMAAGITMEARNIPILRKNLNDACAMADEDFSKKIYIDADLTGTEITMKLASELARLSPFGSGNYEPVFMARGVKCIAVDRIGKDRKTLRFAFIMGSKTIKGIAFGKIDDFALFLGEKAEPWLEKNISPCPFTADIAFSIEINEYNGLFEQQVKVVDFRNTHKHKSCKQRKQGGF